MGKIKTAKDKRLAAMVRGESKRYPHHLQEVPKEAWPIRMRYAEQAPAKVMRSRKFLVQICPELDGFTRLSI